MLLYKNCNIDYLLKILHTKFIVSLNDFNILYASPQKQFGDFHIAFDAEKIYWTNKNINIIKDFFCKYSNRIEFEECIKTQKVLENWNTFLRMMNYREFIAPKILRINSDLIQEIKVSKEYSEKMKEFENIYKIIYLK